MAEAKWRDGKSELPQARPAANIEWAWGDGRSGPVAAEVYVAPAGGLSIPVAMHHYQHTMGR